jgi:hypothetical protein
MPLTRCIVGPVGLEPTTRGDLSSGVENGSNRDFEREMPPDGCRSLAHFEDHSSPHSSPATVAASAR